MMRKLTLADAMNVTSFLSNKLMSLAQEQVDPSGDIPSVIELLSETASSVHEDLTMDFTESDSKPTSSSTTQQSQSTKKERKSTPVPITIEVKETPSTASDSVCEEVQLFYQKLEEEFDEADGGAAMIFPEEDLWSHKVVTSQCDAYGFPLAPIEDPPTSSDDDDDDAENAGDSDQGGDRSDFSNASSALLEPFRQQHRRQKSANAKLEFTDTAKEEEKPQGRRLTPPNLREVKSWGILTEAQLRRRASQMNEAQLLQSNSEGELRSSRNSNNTVGTPDSIRKRFLGQLSSSEFLSTKIIQLAEEQVARPAANASTTPLTSGGKQRRQRRRDKAAKLEGLCLLDFNGEPIDPLSTDLFGDSVFPPQEKKSSQQQQQQEQQHHHQQEPFQQQQQLQDDDDEDKWFASFPSVSTTATSSSSKDMSSVDGFEPEKFNDPFQQLSEKQVELEAKEVLLEEKEVLLEENEVLLEDKKVVSRRRRKPRRSRRSKSQ